MASLPNERTELINSVQSTALIRAVPRLNMPDSSKNTSTVPRFAAIYPQPGNEKGRPRLQPPRKS